MQDTALREMRHNEEICSRQDGREHVLCDHHLRPREASVHTRRREDMVLGRIG